MTADFTADQTVTHPKNPLGSDVVYPRSYAPEILFPIARADSRQHLRGAAALFEGIDLWNAWELSWLGAGSQPAVASAEIVVPADTPNLIESKSLKVYLNSFAMTRFDDKDAVAATIADDLSANAGGPVTVRVDPISKTRAQAVAELAGLCLDSLAVSCDTWDVDAGLLRADDASVVEEQLHTHALRSLCPVTGQPDTGSLQIHYHGPKIEPESLLRYVVSFREHNDFHEACIERLFVDLKQRCRPHKLSVYARYQRRGGIDINPFRSDFEACPGNLRLWRQ